MLLRFGEFSGCGIKSSMGMGAIAVEAICGRIRPREHSPPRRPHRNRARLPAPRHRQAGPARAARLPWEHSAIGRAFLKKVWLADARNPTEFDDVVDEPDIDARDRAILTRSVITTARRSAPLPSMGGWRPTPSPTSPISLTTSQPAPIDARRPATATPRARASGNVTPLYSVFNRFGEGTQALRFRPELLDDREPINVAVDKDFDFDKYRYTEITEKLREQLSGLERSESYVTSLLNVLEATLSFVPSSTDAAEVVDISLFDHLKLTAAFGSCIWHVLQEERVSDYRSALLDGQEKFYATDSFLLTTFDLSGIQDFIYTIHSDGAAKMLRARSFYLGFSPNISSTSCSRGSG